MGNRRGSRGDVVAGNFEGCENCCGGSIIRDDALGNGGFGCANPEDFCRISLCRVNDQVADIQIII